MEQRSNGAPSSLSYFDKKILSFSVRRTITSSYADYICIWHFLFINEVKRNSPNEYRVAKV